MHSSVPEGASHPPLLLHTKALRSIRTHQHPQPLAFQEPPHSGTGRLDEREEEEVDGEIDDGEWGDNEDGSGLTLPNVRDALASNTAKLVYGVGGATIAGVAGLKYARSRLARLYREHFLRPRTALTDLLGHVLLKNTNSTVPVAQPDPRRDATATQASGIWGGLYGHLIGVRGSGFGPTGTKHVATGDVTRGKVTAIYINGGGLEDYLQRSGYVVFTPRLTRIYESAKRRGHPLEVVYVSVDEKAKAAVAHFHKMPWYGLPFNNPSNVRRIIKQLGVRTLPAVVLVDDAGMVINEKAYNSMLAAPDGFPWPLKSITEVLGETFINNKNETISASTFDDKVLGVYFCADRVPVSRQLTPNLRDLYNNRRNQTDDFEVVFVSNDKDQQSFSSHFGDRMPWIAVPFNDTARRAMLQDSLDVRALPTLVMLDKKQPDGSRKVLNRRAAASVLRDPDGKQFPWVPPLVQNVSDSIDGLTDNPSVVVFMEGVDSSIQRRITEVLENVSKEIVEGGDSTEPKTIASLSSASGKRMGFLTATKADPKAEALRLLCKLPPSELGGGKTIPSPRLVLMDLADQAFYKHNLETGKHASPVDEAAIRLLISSYLSEKVKRQPIDVSALRT